MNQAGETTEAAATRGAWRGLRNLLFKGAQLRAYLAHADELGMSIDDRTPATAS
jgi:hypothetical protein